MSSGQQTEPPITDPNPEVGVLAALAGGALAAIALRILFGRGDEER